MMNTNADAMAQLTTDVVIIGAGPAGLTAAYELSKAGRQTIVLEKGPLVGGMAGTETYKGYGVDIGWRSKISWASGTTCGW